ncbi:MAG: hypothetical protein WB952_14540 [Terriglobales bacterium]
MKLVGVISTAVLSLILGAAAPAYAQEQHDQQGDQKDKSVRQDDRKPQEEKTARQEEKTAQQQDRNAKQEDRTAQQQDRNAKQEDRTAQQQGRNANQEDRVAHEQGRDNDHGRRIPDDRFRANFGHEHVFIINRPVIVEGHPRFQYGGYWFGYAEPWPVGWNYSDNVYVDYTDGGYYLYNRVHPGIRISLNIF